MANNSELLEEHKRLELVMEESRKQEKEERIRREKEKREAALLAREKKQEKLMAQKAKLEEESPMKKAKLDKTPHKQQSEKHIEKTVRSMSEDFKAEGGVATEKTPEKDDVDTSQVQERGDITPVKEQCEVKTEECFEDHTTDVSTLKSIQLVGTCVPEGDMLDAVSKGEVTPKKSDISAVDQKPDRSEIMKLNKEHEIIELEDQKEKLGNESGGIDSILNKGAENNVHDSTAVKKESVVENMDVQDVESDAADAGLLMAANTLESVQETAANEPAPLVENETMTDDTQEDQDKTAEYENVNCGRQNFIASGGKESVEGPTVAQSVSDSESNPKEIPAVNENVPMETSEPDGMKEQDAENTEA